MKRQRRFGTEVEAPAIAAAQIRTLIDSIGHYVQSLNYDIETVLALFAWASLLSRLFAKMVAMTKPSAGGCHVETVLRG